MEKEVAGIHALAEHVEAGGDATDEAGRQFQALLKRDHEWPLLFYEFWSFGVRNFVTSYLERESLLRGFVTGYSKIHHDEQRHIGYGTWDLVPA